MELKSWKMDALPYLVYAPIKKLPKEKEIIRSLKNLAKKADSVVIAPTSTGKASSSARTRSPASGR